MTSVIKKSIRSNTSNLKKLTAKKQKSKKSKGKTKSINFSRSKDEEKNLMLLLNKLFDNFDKYNKNKKNKVKLPKILKKIINSKKYDYSIVDFYFMDGDNFALKYHNILKDIFDTYEKKN